MEKKWRRRGLLCAEEEDDDESVMQFQAKNDPYRRLAMQEQFTPPRKKSKTFVPETDDECEALLCDLEEQSEEEESMTPTPRLAVDIIKHSGNSLKNGVSTGIKKRKSMGISMRFLSSH